MALFDPRTGDFPSLTPEESDSLTRAFDSFQLPLQYAFRSDIRWEKETKKNGLLAFSPFFIKLFEQEEYGKEFKCYAEIHINEVEMLAHSYGKFVLVQTKKSKLTVTADESLKFAQYLYRNIALTRSFSSESMVEIHTDKPELFPEFDFTKPFNSGTLSLSLTQKFQFNYCAKCTEEGIPYNQEVVRYIHTLMLSGNSIIDVSQMPLETEIENDLNPVFEALGVLTFVSGVCCYNLSKPDVFRALAPLIANDGSVRIVHFENCNASGGLEEIASKIKKNQANQIAYWNISNNPFENFSPFCEVMTNSKSPLLYLNVSNCNIKSPVSEELFNVLAKNTNTHGLKHLYIAGMELKSISNLERFLSKANKLETFDIGGMNEIVGSIIDALSRCQNNLKKLILAKSKFNNSLTETLIKYVKKSSSLFKLDLSDLDCSLDSIADVIVALAKNPNLIKLSLSLNNLNINDEGLLSMYRAFLSTDLGKWVSLSFDRNNMSAEDLHNITPLFIRMPNLLSLSLSDNFHSEMTNIGDYITDLLRIPSLTRLIISGGETNKLQGQLYSLLTKNSKRDILEYLDISNNDAGESIQMFTRTILSSKKLKTFIIDGNFNGIDQLDTIVKNVEKNDSLISMPFPVNDSKKLAVDNGKEIVGLLSDLQMRAVNAINANRTRKMMPNDLPFPVTPEIKALIDSISHQTRQSLREKIPKKHSAVCDVFHIPLPFQKMGEIVEDGGEERNVEIGDLEVYDTESMKRIIIAGKSFQTCMFATMQFTRLITAAQPAVPIKRKRKRSASSVSSELESSKSDSSSTSSYDIPAKKPTKRRVIVKKSSSSESYNETPPVKPKRKTRKDISSSDSDNIKPSRNVVKRSPRALPSSSDSDSDYNSDSNSDSNSYQKPPPKQIPKNKKQYINDESSDSDEPVLNRKRQVISSSDDSDDIPPKKFVNRPRASPPPLSKKNRPPPRNDESSSDSNENNKEDTYELQSRYISRKSLDNLVDTNYQTNDAGPKKAIKTNKVRDNKNNVVPARSPVRKQNPVIFNLHGIKSKGRPK